jgi:branched-chain amino acid transport system permease protein
VTGAAGQVYGSRFYSMPSPFPLGADAQWRIGGARLRYDTVGIVGVLLGVLALMWVLQRTTRLGLAFRAVASNQESASLAGVPVGRILALGWGCAGALGALAGALVANNVLVSTSMMTRLLIFALAAATIGGLDSPMGAALGGLIVALLETMLGGYVPFIGGDISIVAALVVLSVVLVLRPAGLLGRRALGRV